MRTNIETVKKNRARWVNLPPRVVRTEQKGNIRLFAKLDHRSIMQFARKSTSFKMIRYQKRAIQEQSGGGGGHNLPR